MNLRSEAELKLLLAQGMGQELHWCPEDVPLSRLASALVGMANSAGGTLILGIAPRSSEVIGLRDPDAAMDRVFQAILLADPALVLPIPQRVKVASHTGEAGRDVLWITVPRGLPHVYCLDGRYLGREGAQTNPLSARRLRALLVERGAVQFEARAPQDTTLDDLDPLQVQAYLDKVIQAGLLPGSLTADELLFRRGCLKRVDGMYQPTYAGLMLFGRYPQQWLPNATILAGVTIGEEAMVGALMGSITDSAWLGLFFGVLSSVLLAALHAVLSIKYKINQIISGTVINIFATGITSYLSSKFIQKPDFQYLNEPGMFPQIQVPGLSQIPFLGPILFSHNIYVFAMVFFVLLLTFLFFFLFGVVIEWVGARAVLAFGAAFALFLAWWVDLRRLPQSAFLPFEDGGEVFTPTSRSG